MGKHPFNEGTKLAQIYTILSDGQWHCGKHELPGTQPAKAIQVMRQHGFEIENKTIFCEKCDDKTVHRRLISLEPTKPSYVRQVFPSHLRKKILTLYDCTEAITMRKLKPQELEVDHRFPQIRWSTEETLDLNMGDSELKAKFQLLTRQHNLWKSRYCEKCYKTGIRGTFIGINFFYVGGPLWDNMVQPDDERGCIGCFWYNPEEWRKSLNEVVKEK